jgi:DNA-binding transcriptional ArsR family regulator
MTANQSPPRAELVVTSNSQLRALANGVRLRIIGLLRGRTWTMNELADELGIAKGSVSYHLRLLERAGIAAQSELRNVRGGAQQTWSLSAPAIAVQLDRDDPIARPTVLRTLASQMERTTEQRLFVSQLRLSSEARLSAITILEQALESIRHLEEDGEDLVTLASFVFSSEQAPGASDR